MTTVLGGFPETLLARSKDREKYFDSQGRRIHARSNLTGLMMIAGQLLQPCPSDSCSLEQFSRNPDNSGSGKQKFTSFIRSMIRLDPAERPEANELLESEWPTLTL